MQKRRKKKKQSRDGIINQADLFSKYWHQHPATETLYQPPDRFEMFYSWLFHPTVSLKMPNSLIEAKKTFFTVCIKSEYFAKTILLS